jgi:hypothetical protein
LRASFLGQRARFHHNDFRAAIATTVIGRP